jgi:hypothetical protein
MKPEYVFLLFGLFIVGNFAWRYFRSGRSLAGALLGGRVVQEVGEVVLKTSGLSSQALRVMALDSPGGERSVGVSVVSKAPMAYGMVAYKLSRAQAQELVALLQRASSV